MRDRKQTQTKIYRIEGKKGEAEGEALLRLVERGTNVRPVPGSWVTLVTGDSMPAAADEGAGGAGAVRHPCAHIYSSLCHRGKAYLSPRNKAAHKG